MNLLELTARVRSVEKAVTTLTNQFLKNKSNIDNDFNASRADNSNIITKLRVYAEENETLQQKITTMDLEDIEKGQYITDMDLRLIQVESLLGGE